MLRSCLPTIEDRIAKESSSDEEPSPFPNREVLVLDPGIYEEDLTTPDSTVDDFRSSKFPQNQPKLNPHWLSAESKSENGHRQRNYIIHVVARK